MCFRHHASSRRVKETRITRLLIRDGDVATGGESTWEDNNTPLNALKRFVEDIGHLVFKVLSGNEGVEEVDSILALEGNDLAAGTANVVVDSNAFPMMVNRRWSWNGTNIKEDTDIGLEDGSESVEEPAVRVDFPLIFLFETEDNLDGDDTFFGSFDFECGSDGYLGSVLIYVSGYSPLANLQVCLCDTFLVASHGSDDTQRPGVHICATVADNANYNFLPAFLTPGLNPVPLTQMSKVFDDTMHRSREEFFVLVVHRHNNQEFGTVRRIPMDLPESEPIVLKIVGITGSS
jgi:hypothetical protein